MIKLGYGVKVGFTATPSNQATGGGFVVQEPEHGEVLEEFRVEPGHKDSAGDEGATRGGRSPGLGMCHPLVSGREACRSNRLEIRHFQNRPEEGG